MKAEQTAPGLVVYRNILSLPVLLLLVAGTTGLVLSNDLFVCVCVRALCVSAFVLHMLIYLIFTHLHMHKNKPCTHSAHFYIVSHCFLT